MSETVPLGWSQVTLGLDSSSSVIQARNPWISTTETATNSWRSQSLRVIFNSLMKFQTIFSQLLFPDAFQ